MSMLYEFNVEGDSKSLSNPSARTFYIIGGLMFLGGLTTLVLNFIETDPVRTAEWVLDAITTLGGLAFVAVGYNTSKNPSTHSIYAIQMDDDTIKVISEYGSKCEEMSYKDISKIDFQNNNIYLHSQSNAPVDINLSLIHPEGKREKLKAELDGIMVKYQILD